MNDNIEETGKVRRFGWWALIVSTVLELPSVGRDVTKY